MNKVYQRLFATTAGKGMVLFIKWRSIPERKNTQLVKNANRFEHALAKLAARCLRLGFNPLQEQLQEGEALKKRAIINLLNKTMSQHKRMFLSWSNTMKSAKALLKCRRTIMFCESLN